MAAKAATTAQFTVAYDGPGVADGTMDVRELAPALLSLGALCERANQLANGDRAKVSVRVQAGAVRGSFPVDIQLVQLADIAQALFEQVRNANDLVKLILGVTGAAGLLPLIKLLRGRKPDKIENTPQGTQITAGNTTIIVDNRVSNLYLDPEARRHARGVVRPLEGPSVDVVKFRSGDLPEEEVITEEEVEYFDVEPTEQMAEELIPPSTATFAFEIVKVPLTEAGGAWHLRNDTMNVPASMEDAVFQARMNAGEETFAVGDVLIVRLRTETYQDEEGKIRTRHFIERVTGHRHAARQTRLPMPRGN